MHITLLGAGYVGLVTGACLAEAGHDVTCVDVDTARIAQLQVGHLPLFEPGLEPLVHAQRQAGRLRFGPLTAEDVARADVVFIAVGTAARRGDGHADLTFVHAAVRSIAPHLQDDAVVVLKSTVPVGTSDDVEDLLKREVTDRRVHVASNPEFLREGSALQDFRSPDRIVVGAASTHARRVLDAVYAPLTNAGPVVHMDRRSAELTKYASNAFLATKVAFIDEMADLAEQVGADVRPIAYAMGLDERIGPRFLRPGPGFGGSCLPKDTLALSRTAREAGAPVTIVEAVIRSNDARKRAMVDRIEQAVNGLSGRRIGVLGLTFKAGTDDLREAPALTLVPGLCARGATLTLHDPQAGEFARRLWPDCDVVDDPYAVAAGADAVVLLTGWPLYATLDLGLLASTMRDAHLIDLRNVFDGPFPSGLRYTPLGRPQNPN